MKNKLYQWALQLCLWVRVLINGALGLLFKEPVYRWGVTFLALVELGLFLWLTTLFWKYGISAEMIVLLFTGALCLCYMGDVVYRAWKER